MRPGQWLTRALVFFDNRGVDGAVNGLAAALGGWLGRLRPHADRLRPHLRPRHARRRRARRGRTAGGDGGMSASLTLGQAFRRELTSRSCCHDRAARGRRGRRRCAARGAATCWPSRWRSAVAWSSLVLAVARDGRLRRRRRPVPADHVGTPGSRLRRALRLRRRRHRAGDAAADRRARAGRDRARPGTTTRRRDGRSAASTRLLRLLLLLEAMMIGVFAATDVFLFYVFFEAMLVPMYFLIGSFGGPRRQYAAVKFFLYSLVGGLFMLAAVIGLYVVAQPAGHGTFAFDALRQLRHHPGRAEAGCSSASSSPSRSRRRSCRSTPGCPTPVPRRPSAAPCCWSACWTRSARSASCATACRCSPTRRGASRRWCWCWPSSASSTPRCWRWARAT